MQWKLSGKQNVYLEIAERYREYIRLGVLPAGEKLPSVRQAAVELGVNPNTIARAYAHLEEMGAVRSIPKKGIYVVGNGEPEEATEMHAKELLRGLRAMGISHDVLLKWTEEVYRQDD